MKTFEVGVHNNVLSVDGDAYVVEDGTLKIKRQVDGGNGTTTPCCIFEAAPGNWAYILENTPQEVESTHGVNSLGTATGVARQPTMAEKG